MKCFTSVDTSVLRQHYEKKVQELEHEKKALQVACFSFNSLNILGLNLCHGPKFIAFSIQKEIEDLKCNLCNISSTSDDGAQKLKEEYLQKLNLLEAQVILKLSPSLNWISCTRFIFCFAGFRVEEETRCSSSTIETETKKRWGCKTTAGWNSEN